MPSLKVLILGGTGEACALAEALVRSGHHPVTSLAGVTRNPRVPAGGLRTGSLGGSAGLARLLKVDGFDALVDATHPFAAAISANAHDAALHAGLPLYRLERPAWVAGTGDIWISVGSIAEAVEALPPQSCVFLTTGHKDLVLFMARDDITGTARMIEPPSVPLRAGWQLLLSRPPHSQDEEEALMRERRISHLVSKNAGGEATKAKLMAARQLGLPVIMIERPLKPAVKTFSSIAEVCERLG